MKRLAALALVVILAVVAATAWGYFTAETATGGSGAAAASRVNPGSTPSASADGESITVSWAATTLSTGQAVNGYLVRRYDALTDAAQSILAGCSGTIATTSCVETPVPNGSWKYTVTPVFANSWRGAESAKSAAANVAIDSTAPSNAITVSSVSGGAFLDGTTAYYRGSSAGSLRLTNAVTDSGSGPASSQTSELTGSSTGWTHTPSVESAPASGPYLSNPFAWSAATTSGPGVTVTGRDAAGNTAVTNLTFVDDSTSPSAGSISYADGVATGTSASISFTTGTDAGSGLGSRQLQRAAATLTNTTCGTFGAFADIGSDGPASPYVDSSLGSACYRYRYVVSDKVGNRDIATSSNVVKVGYAGAVTTTTGLLSHWRFGEAAQSLISADTFNNATGTSLASHTSGGTTWTRVAGTSGVNSVITDQGRARRSGTGFTIYTAAQSPATADYAVEADFHYKSDLIGDMSGILGRYDGTTGYMARYERADQSWNIVKVSSGSSVAYGPAGSYLTAQPLTVGETYRVRLEISGSSTTTLRLFVNGVQKAIWTDSTSPITAAGKGGLYDGNASSIVSKSDTGLHLDNFQMTPSTYSRAADSKGSNPGDYKNGPTLGVTGALSGDANSAGQFDGVNDYVHMTSTTGLPVGDAARSTELWFKTSSAARQVLFAYGSAAATQEYGLWLDAGGTTMTAWGYGSGHDKVFTMPTALNNGAWHQVVKTYDGTAIRLYIDGVALAPQSATRSTVIDQWSLAIGAILRTSDGNAGGHFAGAIDEVSFYNTVLSQATVTAHYELGGAAAVDTTGPTGGSVDAAGLVGTGARYSTSTALSLDLVKGSDPSGVAAAGHQLLRATASLTGGSCGTFGSYTLVSGGNDPASPKADTVADQACYSYQYVVLDTLGNSSTYTSPQIKVDTTAPAAPSLSFGDFTNTYWSGSGTTIHYRSAAASGSVTVTGTASDAASGIASVTFPGLGTNWTSTPGALGVTTYSWSGAPAAPGTRQVTATNNAGSTSANAPFTFTVDDAAPTAGTVTYENTSQTSTSISVGFTTGTDADSGVGTRLLQRASASLTGSTCGAYGGFATIAGGTNPISSSVVDTVTRGSCYMYQYVVSDHVGNVRMATSANVVKVTTYAATISATTGLVNFWRLGDAVSSAVMDDITAANNDGTYFGSPTRGVAGALTGDANTAVQFNGSSQYATAPRQISGNFSIELWVKSTQNFSNDFGNPHCTQWWQGAGLVDADVSGSFNDFGLSMCAGKIIAGVGSPDVSIATSATYNDGNWHHVVFTRTQATGALALYVDGAAAGTATSNTNDLTSQSTLNVARSTAGVNYFAGTLDEIAVYNTVLAPATVASHFGAR